MPGEEKKIISSQTKSCRINLLIFHKCFFFHLKKPIKYFDKISLLNKEVCNRGVACSPLKLGSLEKTVLASLFHSGTIFCGKNVGTTAYAVF